MSDSVIYQQDGGVVTLTLNEPETRNALSPSIGWPPFWQMMTFDRWRLDCAHFASNP